ncbi:MAG TPA: rhodanese-like domain-containing protein, partial [Myxococcales bacterium]|nr:rhodanese-like domain-containing protein [Myxococcales bacterium]
APGARADARHEEGFGELTVDQVADLIAKKDVDVFDNNSRSDFDKGHVPTAKWVAFNQVKAGDLPADKSRKLVFYCANSH